MPKKRTKQQKIRAQYHYAFPVSRSFSGIKQTGEERSKSAVAVFEKTSDTSSLYAYDPYFTRSDIRRTVLFSLILLAIQLALFWWWK